MNGLQKVPLKGDKLEALQNAWNVDLDALPRPPDGDSWNTGTSSNSKIARYLPKTSPTTRANSGTETDGCYKYLHKLSTPTSSERRRKPCELPCHRV